MILVYTLSINEHAHSECCLEDLIWFPDLSGVCLRDKHVMGSPISHRILLALKLISVKPVAMPTVSKTCIDNEVE